MAPQNKIYLLSFQQFRHLESITILKQKKMKFVREGF